ncbi:MAG TPA: hypothetical protein VL693_17185 [Vicinamibacterales bacterium]|jgi:hypothetical protein|nr:hypothetical protein [Vicinamibacterales bacterium]
MKAARLARLLLCGGLIIVSSASGAFAQSKDDPALGSWKLNVAKSKFTPGPPIKGDTRSYEVNNEGWLLVTTETIQPDGRRTGVRFAAKFDGKPYPQIGRFAPTVTLITYEQVDKRTLKYTQYDSNGKVNSTNTRTVSADGKTMTIEQRSTDEKGRPTVNVELFERQ